MERQDMGTGEEFAFGDIEYEPDSHTRSEQVKSLLVKYLYLPGVIIWEDWRARFAVIVLIGYGLMGTVGVYLVEAPTSYQGNPFTPAFQSLETPLGTDGTGQSLLSLIVHATPSMFEMIIAGAVFSTFMATVVGVYSGYKSGTVDTALMTVTDIMLTIPGLPLVIVIAAVIEPSQPWVVGIILTINAWAGLARAIRSEVLTLRQIEYVEASQTMGLSTYNILSKDILPNIMPYVLVNFVNSARGVIFGSVALYFLGLLPFTNLNWGVVLNFGYRSGSLYGLANAHLVLVPIVVIVVLSFAMILLSQSTDRFFNPRVRAKHSNKAKPTDEQEVDSRESEEDLSTLGGEL